MMLDGDHQREWKHGESAHQPRGVHRAQSARGEDPQGFRELRGVTAAAVTDTQARSPPSSIASGPSRRARRWSQCIFSGTRRCSCSARRRCCSSPRTARKSAFAVHGGGILAAACDGARILTGGDDGKVVATDADGESETLATDAKHRWIDRVALGPDGAVAWSGRQAGVRAQRQGRDQVARSALERRRARFRAEGPAARGRALRRRDAVVSQRAGRARNARLEGLASRRAVQPGRQVPGHQRCRSRRCTAGAWSTARTCACRAIPAKVRSMAFTPGGKWLATSGSEQLILWPFATKDGPMGKQPRMVAPYDKRAVVVACHPEAGDRRVGLRGRPGDALPHRGRRGDLAKTARQGRRSRRSPGARTAPSSRSGRKTARPGSSIWREAACHRNAVKAVMTMTA